MRVNSSITVCAKCGGDSQIEDVRKQDTRYVKRSRACKLCGLTWTTAEIPLEDVKLLKLVKNFIKEAK
jgi:transcriptional regulator NrdR family protein